MGRYGGMVNEIESLVNELDKKGQLETMLNTLPEPLGESVASEQTRQAVRTLGDVMAMVKNLTEKARAAKKEAAGT